MNPPYHWLDITVVICAVAALIFGLLLINRSPSPLRGKLKFLSVTLTGVAFLIAGFDSYLTLNDAPRSISVGTITHLKSDGSKNQPCAIALLDAEQTLSVFIGSFPCDGLQTGDQVRLQWMNFNHRIARLDVIAGPDKGSVRIGGNSVLGFFDFALGLFFLYAAHRSRRFNPTGIPVDRDSQSGNVDEASLLNLSDS
jgi:hypothetical protein